jgi:hypothetical protein
VSTGVDRVLASARRAAEAGNIAGLFEGLMLCASWYGCGTDVDPDDRKAVKVDEAGVLVPRWIVRNALKYMRRELLTEGTCPTQKWRAQFIRDMKFMYTLEDVESALEAGAKWTDGDVYEAVAAMNDLTPAQVEGRYKRGKREYRATAKTRRHYVPMFIRAPRNGDESS